MKSIVLTLVGSFMLWMLVGCDGFLDEYSITEVRPTELTDIEQLLLGDAYLDAGQRVGERRFPDLFREYEVAFFVGCGYVQQCRGRV